MAKQKRANNRALPAPLRGLIIFPTIIFYFWYIYFFPRIFVPPFTAGFPEILKSLVTCLILSLNPLHPQGLEMDWLQSSEHWQNVTWVIWKLAKV